MLHRASPRYALHYGRHHAAYLTFLQFRYVHSGIAHLIEYSTRSICAQVSRGILRREQSLRNILVNKCRKIGLCTSTDISVVFYCLVVSKQNCHVVCCRNILVLQTCCAWLQMGSFGVSEYRIHKLIHLYMFAELFCEGFSSLVRTSPDPHCRIVLVIVEIVSMSTLKKCLGHCRNSSHIHTAEMSWSFAEKVAMSTLKNVLVIVEIVAVSTLQKCLGHCRNSSCIHTAEMSWSS